MDQWSKVFLVDLGQNLLLFLAEDVQGQTAIFHSFAAKET